jgi:hypothetical protein
MQATISRLNAILADVPAKLKTLSESDLSHKPRPDKWSKKETLGHLVDSALNNLKRFADAQVLPPPYRVVTYLQDGLVSVNHYQQMNTAALLNLWHTLNSQIVWVVQHLPAEKLSVPVITQDDAKSYTDTAPSGQHNRTLQWLIEDYVAHHEHHLKEILP